MKGIEVRNFYLLKGTTVQGESCVGVDSAKCLDTTKPSHLRLGHTSKKNLKLLRRKKIRGESFNILDFFKECVLSKQTKASFGAGKHTSIRVIDYVHSTVWGPISTASIGGAHYFIFFIDDYSCKVLGVCNER